MTSLERHQLWSELTSLIDKLLDAPQDERGALVQQLSAGDLVRRADLDALLAQCEREPALLSVPAADRFAKLFESERRFPDALAERYVVTRELGRGGMATVYLARDVKHNRDVAVKVMLPVVASMLGTDRFLREIELVAQLRHPHIVPLFDSGNADGALYYVMPYEPGLSLRERLGHESLLPPEQVIVILRDICDALAYAHAQGIVHRDIKPDNVLLSGQHALVADFGIAKAASDAALQRDPESGPSLGTPMYMAPEQILGDARLDHRADIYAVGALGYELLTGAPPFVGDGNKSILRRLRESPEPLTARRPDVPIPLADVVMRCLQREPSDRWQTAGELLEQLESLAATARNAKDFRRRRRRTQIIAAAVAIAALGLVSALAWRSSREQLSWRSRWSKMRIEKITDFPGSEVDAAISRDGKVAAFLSDRDSVFDAFVTAIGSGRFTNLTAGRYDQLLNEDVRNIGFSPDGSQVWIRVADLNSPASVSLLPATGGPARPFLNTAVMVAWSPDGARLAYHETTPGDPIFVASGDGTSARQIVIGARGLHSHHLTWSPDGRFVYFAHGVPPDEMDIWRVSAAGGSPERITSHNSRVAYPVVVDDHTLLYTATADDGTGPWLYMMDVEDRVPTRLSTGVEHFLSIAASAEVPGQPRRLVATVSNPSVELWTIPLTDGVSGEETASRLSLPTARAAAPRFAHDSSLLYLASRSGADGLWRLSGTTATEIWQPTDGALGGAAGISPDGKKICFAVRHRQRSTLRCALADGSGVATLADSLDVRGAPSWSQDGRWIAVAVKDGEAVRVFRIPAQGGVPQRLVDSVSSNPVWSPDGKFVLYSGIPRGRSVPLKAVTPDGKPFPLPFAPLLVDRLGDSYRFLPDGKTIVVKLGGFRRQDFWLFDVASGKRRQLTRFRPGQSLLRFDVSPDGTRIVFERVRENSDIALIEVPARQ
jgi:serine/threonine protein kinase/Tol biopolymer transport system component